jgi:L-alanine-DL-glutamate epimerase-like enolase superfamily enzyme
MNGGKRIVFDNEFVKSERQIDINGLIWMGTKSQMLEQIDQKLNAGYDTIKMKVGAINFDAELDCLRYIRERYTQEQVTLRVDANGAFKLEEVVWKLSKLADLQIHSIEQPIKQGQLDIMAELCQSTPLPIALDEELIGHPDYMDKFRLLKKIAPQYIILKPTLLGGFKQCREWIEIAKRLNIGWWMTSALESNIGLNAITQFTAEYQNLMPQGLGTGSLFDNNLTSPLEINKGKVLYNQSVDWDLGVIKEQLG